MHTIRVDATDEDPQFRELAWMTEVNDLVDWLRHGPMKDKEHRRRWRGQIVTIEEAETIFVIYRAIEKFDAVFGDQKTPQMVSFRIAQLEASTQGTKLRAILTPRDGDVRPDDVYRGRRRFAGRYAQRRWLSQPFAPSGCTLQDETHEAIEMLRGQSTTSRVVRQALRLVVSFAAGLDADQL